MGREPQSTEGLCHTIFLGMALCQTNEWICTRIVEFLDSLIGVVRLNAVFHRMAGPIPELSFLFWEYGARSARQKDLENDSFKFWNGKCATSWGGETRGHARRWWLCATEYWLLSRRLPMCASFPASLYHRQPSYLVVYESRLCYSWPAQSPILVIVSTGRCNQWQGRSTYSGVFGRRP